MKFDENLAAIHAYLCADGCVIRNPPSQKLKYYKIDFRNTNLVLLEDFQMRFFEYFNIKPHLYPGQRCQIGSKEIYYKLIDNFGSFHSYKWSAPRFEDNNLLRVWLRAFFDCEGWVFCKSHQNRHVGIDSVNEKGLDQIKKDLEKLGIFSIKKVVKNGKMFRLFIYGKENLENFRLQINFLHPTKKEKLNDTLNDFVSYRWDLKSDKKIIKALMQERVRVRDPYYVRVVSKEKDNLTELSKFLNEFFLLDRNLIKVHERFNGRGTKYFELSINKKNEVKKLVEYKLINDLQLSKIDFTKLK